MTDKQALRSSLRTARDGFGVRSIMVPPAFLVRLSKGLTIASYVPIGSEADPSRFIRAAVEAGCEIALPHVVDRRKQMRFLAWDGQTALAAGPFGLSQPDHEAAERAPDIILTPLVGFDRQGNRIGQGAGYYDRAFIAYPDAWRIGIALSVQETPPLTPDAWDVPLHAIATELEWIVP